MTLPLPNGSYSLEDEDPFDKIAEDISFIAKQFPISRKSLKTETINEIGGAGQPAFENAWANYDITAFMPAGFWLDAQGIVHLRGLIKNGAPVISTIFTLPAGYRPSNRLVFVADLSGAHGRVDVLANGQVAQVAAGVSTYLSLSGIHFRKEQ